MSKKYRWTIRDNVEKVLYIKSDLRHDLAEWIFQNYQIENREEEIKRLANFIIDTFLDEYASTRVKVRASTAVNRGSQQITQHPVDEYDDYYDEDVEKGDILAFTRRCVNQGWRLIRKGNSEEFDGLKPRPKPH
jgi:uncharacterized protein YlaI